MNDFPLAPFIISLAADGIPVSPADYERIALALRTQGEWNRRQLRGVLAALLTHNPEQVGVFNQRFNNFFSENLSAAETITEKHVRGAFQELLRISAGQFDGWEAEQPATAATSRPDSKSSATEPNPSQEPRKKEKKEATESPSINSGGLYKILSTYALGWAPVIALAAWTVYIGVNIIYPEDPAQNRNTATNTNTNTQPTPTNTAPPSGRQEFGAAGVNKGGDIFVIPTPTRSPNANATTDINPDPGNLTNAGGSGRPQSINIFAIFAAIVLSLAVLFFVMFRIKRRPGSYFDLREPLSFDSDGPGHYALNKIGGPPSPYLDAATLGQLSKALNHFVSDSAFNVEDFEPPILRRVKTPGRLVKLSIASAPRVAL